VRILVSAGEASGDLYAARVVEILKARLPDAEFFGCAGPRMQAVGVRPVVDQRSLAVVGIVEVLGHLPRIWGEFQKLVRAAAIEKPDLAILTDAPDFHLRVAKKLKRLGIPVIYLIAPQAWAWREGRVKGMRETIERLLCIFPFEERFFADRGVPTTYIGHPLARLVKPALTRAELLAKPAGKARTGVRLCRSRMRWTASSSTGRCREASPCRLPGSTARSLESPGRPSLASSSARVRAGFTSPAKGWPM